MNDPWFKDGLRFKCTECGGCCTGAPGYVWLKDGESKTIAKHLGISESEFLQKFTRHYDGRLSLLEDTENYDCVFLKDNKCSIYNVRPKQCRTFPWWKENISSEAAWCEAAEYCEGINHPDAPVVDAKEILYQLGS